MNFADTSLFFKDFAEPITIDGQTVQALVDVELATALGLVGGQGTLIQVPEGTAVQRGSTVAARGKTYTVARPPFVDVGIITLEVTLA